MRGWSEAAKRSAIVPEACEKALRCDWPVDDRCRAQRIGSRLV